MDIKALQNKFHIITKILIDKGLTITTMESMTAGLIASLITDTEGASAVMKGAFITYSNEAKVMQGVPKEIIDKHGVYSLETSYAMAKSCKAVYQADIGIGITGTAGNVDLNNKDSVLGEVFCTILYGELRRDLRFKMETMPSRNDYKLYAADKVADELYQLFLRDN